MTDRRPYDDLVEDLKLASRGQGLMNDRQIMGKAAAAIETLQDQIAMLPDAPAPEAEEPVAAEDADTYRAEEDPDDDAALPSDTSPGPRLATTMNALLGDDVDEEPEHIPETLQE